MFETHILKTGLRVGVDDTKWLSQVPCSSQRHTKASLKLIHKASWHPHLKYLIITISSRSVFVAELQWSACIGPALICGGTAHPPLRKECTAHVFRARATSRSRGVDRRRKPGYKRGWAPQISESSHVVRRRRVRQSEAAAAVWPGAWHAPGVYWHVKHTTPPHVITIAAHAAVLPRHRCSGFLSGRVCVFSSVRAPLGVSQGRGVHWLPSRAIAAVAKWRDATHVRHTHTALYHIACGWPRCGRARRCAVSLAGTFAPRYSSP